MRLLRVVGAVIFISGALASIFAAVSCSVVAALALVGGGLFMVGARQ